VKLIVGLGNPGPQYLKTRHNAGFMVIDRLVAAYAPSQPVKARFNAATVEAVVAGERCLLVKPTTFMNLSGKSVTEALRFYKADAAADLVVIVDDFYLATGEVRMKPAGGAGGHNGLTSIEQLLGSDSYPRIRVGVGQQPSGGKPPLMDQSDFVLGRFTSDEEPLLSGALSKAVKAVEVFVSKGIAHAMNTANAGPAKPRSQQPPQTSNVTQLPSAPSTTPITQTPSALS
jgi:PTH1 family peptidyl-tRNA hydrolase